MFSTMASISRSVSAMALLGSVVSVILARASATNLFAPCKQRLKVCVKPNGLNRPGLKDPDLLIND